MPIIDKLAWIEVQNQQVLSTRSYGKDKYYIPGGKREKGESDAEALCREIKEELSIDLVVDSLQFMGVFQAQAHGHPLGTMVQMTCYTAAFLGEVKASAEIEEVRWLRYKNRDKISDVDLFIFEELRKMGAL